MQFLKTESSLSKVDLNSISIVKDEQDKEDRVITDVSILAKPNIPASYFEEELADNFFDQSAPIGFRQFSLECSSSFMENQDSWFVKQGGDNFYQQDKDDQEMVEINQKGQAKQIYQDPSSNFLLTKGIFKKKNANTVRFLIDLAIEHLPAYQEYFGEDVGNKIKQMCQDLRFWHLEKKMNVFKLAHLEQIFGDQNEVAHESAKLCREVFNKILKQKAIQAMKRPRSQIKDKVHYLRVAKIFAIRCRSNILSMRNQIR